MDYLTYDTKGTWRFYEIKVSKNDFYSNANKTFLGHYNYYVMPYDLYVQVKDDIPSHIGVILNGNHVKKKAKKQELGIDEDVLKDSLIRSLYREAEKQMRNENPNEIQVLERKINRLTRDRDDYRKKYNDLLQIGYIKYGPRWYKEDSNET